MAIAQEDFEDYVLEGYMPALNACRQLGLFVKEMKLRVEWVEDAEKFAEELADFYATLLAAAGVASEDLMGGFKEYNIELLAWFRT
jgi:hypothetical protein